MAKIAVRRPVTKVAVKGPGIVKGIRITSGTPGAPGTPGATGGVWFSGAGTPTSGAGAVGDWYINTTNSDVYKKTTVSTWALQMNIKGATGTPGTNGTNGTNGVGVPSGGTTGQVLKKNTGTNYDTGWTSLGTAATKNTGTGAGQIPVLSATPGTPDGTKFFRDDGTWATAGGGGSGAPLAFVTRTATANSVYSISATTSADVDATNLAITVPAVPASGQVRIVFEGFISGPGATNHGLLSLREGTTNIVGTARDAVLSGDGDRRRLSWLLTGLTPGSSHTYKLAARVTAGTMFIRYGSAAADEFTGTSSTFGPITLEAYAA